MSTTTGGSVLTPQTIEDWLLLLAPFLVSIAGFNLTGVLPGTSGLVAAAVVGALAKLVIGLGQNPHVKNWEDWVPFIIIFLTALATNLSADPQFVTYGLYIGLLVKALPVFTQGFNIEDALLFVGSIIGGAGQLTNHPGLVEIGILIALLGKALPSIGTNGLPGTLRVSASTAGT